MQNQTLDDLIKKDQRFGGRSNDYPQRSNYGGRPPIRNQQDRMPQRIQNRPNGIFKQYDRLAGGGGRGYVGQAPSRGNFRQNSGGYNRNYNQGGAQNLEALREYRSTQGGQNNR